MRSAFPPLAVLLGIFVAAPASAADDDLRGGYNTFFHFGSSYVKQADRAVLFAGGAPFPGAGFTTEGDQTMSFEAGIFLHDGWAIAASGTVPTTISNLGTGTIAGLGNLGDENVGYFAATGQYHFNLRGPISPYVGAGLGYMHVFGTLDGAVTDMKVASASGPIVQAGIDFHLNDRAAVYVDVKRFWISTSASGTLGGVPITAEATVDPWVFSTGVGIRF